MPPRLGGRERLGAHPFMVSRASWRQGWGSSEGRRRCQRSRAAGSHGARRAEENGPHALWTVDQRRDRVCRSREERCRGCEAGAGWGGAEGLWGWSPGDLDDSQSRIGEPAQSPGSSRLRFSPSRGRRPASLPVRRREQGRPSGNSRGTGLRASGAGRWSGRDKPSGRRGRARRGVAASVPVPPRLQRERGPGLRCGGGAPWRPGLGARPLVRARAAEPGLGPGQGPSVEARRGLGVGGGGRGRSGRALCVLTPSALISPDSELACPEQRRPRGGWTGPAPCPRAECRRRRRRASSRLAWDRARPGRGPGGRPWCCLPRTGATCA